MQAKQNQPWRPPRRVGKWAKYYRKLISLREHLVRERHHLLEDSAQTASASGMHMADGAIDDFDRDLALCQISSDQDLLYEVEAALKRIELGSYGVCELTGKPIPKPRLDALPWTRYTALASIRLEQQGAVRHPHLGSLPLAPETLIDQEQEDAEKPAKEEKLTSSTLYPSDRAAKAPRHG